jgi:MarR family transcriptional repressor of emrRAB
MSARTANLLAAAARLVEDAVEESVRREFAFAASAPAALISIAHQPGLSIERLRRILGITHSATVRLIDRLQADGLVTRRKTSGRDVQLGLSARGRRMLQRVQRARMAAVEALIEPLSDETRAELDSLLSTVLAAQTHAGEDIYRTCRLCSFDVCQREQPCPVALAAQSESMLHGAR